MRTQLSLLGLLLVGCTSSGRTPTSTNRAYNGPLGTACTADAQCGDTGRCVTGTRNFCSRDCMSDAQCGEGGTCRPDSSGQRRCVRGCQSLLDCAKGTSCVAGLGEVESTCQPINLGGACSGADRCPIGSTCSGQRTIADTGICVANCSKDTAVCGEAAKCAREGVDLVCKTPCIRDEDCDASQACQPDGSCWIRSSMQSGAGGSGGFPGGTGGNGGNGGTGGGGDIFGPAGNGQIGEPCKTLNGCAEGSEPGCILPSGVFPGGYCTALCTQDTDCLPNALCVTVDNSSGSASKACLARCTANFKDGPRQGTCRDGYWCYRRGGESFGYCYIR
jgi:hypothetical protein